MFHPMITRVLVLTPHLFFVLVILSATALPSSAFVRSTTTLGTPTSWFTQCIPIWLNDQESLTLNIEAVEQDLQRALSEWEGVECADLAFVYRGQTSYGGIGFDPNPHAVNQNIVSFVQAQSDWLTDPLAVALTTVTSCQNETEVCAEGTTIDADIQINEAYYVFTASDAEPRDRRMDLLSILTHEVGHLIGLDHPPLPEATMFMSSVEGEIKKRDLAVDDERGLCDIFPIGNDRGCYVESYDLESGLPTQEPEMSIAIPSDSGGCRQSVHTSPLFLTVLLLLIELSRRSFGADLKQRRS